MPPRPYAALLYMLAPRPRTSSALAALLRLYCQIAIWRQGPQDLPAVGILLPLTIAAYVLISALMGELLPPQRADWLAQLGADVAFIAFWYWLLLRIARRPERYLQTATALFGLQTVLAVPSVVSVWLVQRYAGDPLWAAPVYIAALAMLIWTLFAVAHILRATLERPLGLCLILALGQILAEGLLFLALFDKP
jgi:hypothetical protein